MVVYQHIHIYMCAFIGYMSRLAERFKNEWTDLTNGPLNRYYYNNATLDIGNYMLYSIISKAARYHYLLTWFKFSYVLFWFHFLQTMMIIKSHKRSIQTYILYVLAQYLLDPRKWSFSEPLVTAFNWMIVY